ncbi:hypothetical protein Chor_002312 [Crotalus horridus]
MAEKRQAAKPGGGGGEEEEEVPAFFKNLGSGSPKPRQKFCGMFCPVEGSLENKTIDFDSLSSGRGSPTGGKIVAKQRDVAHLGPDAPAVSSSSSSSSSSWPARKVEIRRSTGKEALQNLNDKLRRGGSSELQAELEESPTHLMQGPELCDGNLHSWHNDQAILPPALPLGRGKRLSQLVLAVLDGLLGKILNSQEVDQ